MRIGNTLHLCMVPLLASLACESAPAAGPPAASSDESVLFNQLPVVEAASLHAQTIEEAPASVTVVTDEDIRRRGYRTLGDVLADARGFYVTNDRVYHYVGLRGFSLPGDYNTRFLVMLNGHYMTENIYGSNGFFGQDFGLDMDLVERVEIIRGPSSALYGSNGIFATINVVTKSPVDHPLARVSTEWDTFGERKIQVSSSVNLGHGANLLLSGSVLNSSGQSLYFPEFDRPETNSGWSRGVDGERAYHTFANLVWRDWQFTGYFSAREKQIPTGMYGTIFNDPGSRFQDDRNFVEAAYSHDLKPSLSMRWRIYYDQYRFRGRYDFAADPVTDNRDLSEGDWVGSQVSFRFDLRRLGALTVGGECNADLRNLQTNFDRSPDYHEYLNVNRPDQSCGIFAQQEAKLSKRWTAYAGLRFDDSRNRRHFVSPRLALVYQHSPRTTYKFLYGRAFRNPSSAEMFYDDNGVSQIPNLRLNPEKAHRIEATLERKVSARLTALSSAYFYRMDDLIQAVAVTPEVVQYRNVDHTSARGLEMELLGRPVWDLEASTSLSLQKTTNSPGNALSASPARIGKLRVTVPLHIGGMAVSSGLQYLSSVQTRVGERLSPVYVADATLSSARLSRDFDIVCGVHNLFDRRYYDPAGFGLVMDRLRADGRSVFLKLIWHSRQELAAPAPAPVKASQGRSPN